MMWARQGRYLRVARALVWASIGIAFVLGQPAAAKDDDPWKVHGKLLGGPKKSSGEPQKSTDVSGIACAPTRNFQQTCLLVDDQTQGVQVVILKKDSLAAGDFIRLISTTYDGEFMDLDGEAVAYADGFFYVVGSHGRPRHETDAEKKAEDKGKAKAIADEKTKASTHVFRIRLDLSAVDDGGKLSAAPEIKSSTDLPKFINQDTQLRPFFNQKLENNGLNIEGMAVRDGKIYFGMRGPVLDDTDAVILSVPLTALFDGGNGPAKSHRISLVNDHRARGIRDLTSFEAGFLLIAGPVNDPKDDKVKDGDYSIYSWDGNTKAERLADIKSYGDRVKPEGILPLERHNGKLRVLLFFDGPEEGGPRAIEVKYP